MKVEVPFAPVVISLETRVEVDTLLSILYEVQDFGSKNREQYELATSLCQKLRMFE